MATPIRHTLTYPGATIDEVAAMLITRQFREEVCEAIGVLRQDVTVRPTAEGTTEVTIDQVQPAQGIPSFAKKLVGEEIPIRQHEVWHLGEGGRSWADVDVTIPGRPGEMVGTARLSAANGSVEEIVELDVSVRVPLVGGKVEGLIAQMLVQALEAENRVGRAYLLR